MSHTGRETHPCYPLPTSSCSAKCLNRPEAHPIATTKSRKYFSYVLYTGNFFLLQWPHIDYPSEIIKKEPLWWYLEAAWLTLPLHTLVCLEPQFPYDLIDLSHLSPMVHHDCPEGTCTLIHDCPEGTCTLIHDCPEGTCTLIHDCPGTWTLFF